MISLIAKFGGYDVELEITPGVGVRLVRKDASVDDYFPVGSMAGYDGYNFVYYGRVTKITPKSIWIEAYGRTHRLNYQRFALWNGSGRAENQRQRREWMD